jgi:hypothetical protein
MWKQVDPDNPELKRFVPVLAPGKFVTGPRKPFQSRRERE